MTIGRRIRGLRGWMPQRELARRVGVSLTTISDWERGRSEPLSGKLAAIAQALGVTIGDLFVPDPESGSGSATA